MADVDKDFRCADVDFQSTPAVLDCPIPTESGTFLVDVVLSGKDKDKVSDTNPGQLMEVVKIDTQALEFNSLRDTQKIPLNWLVSPAKAPGGVNVLFRPSGSTSVIDITKAPEVTVSITQGTSSDVCVGTQGTVVVEISNIEDAAGEKLGIGDEIFIFKKLKYALKNQTVDPLDYPCTDTDTATVELWTGSGMGGTKKTTVGTATLKVDK